MINWNQSPYFDDFASSKKFYRILYRPSYAVQAREVTQQQTMLQDQISKFGDHIFKNGAMVIPGQVIYDNQMLYHKMLTNYNSLPVDPINFLGKTVVGEYSKLEGVIMNASSYEDVDNPLTFFVKINNAGDTGTETQFWDGEDIYLKDSTTIRATVAGTFSELSHTIDESGKCAASSIDNGVYYISGQFVDVDAQSIILSKYDALPSLKVGLRTYESVITPEDDLSLNDNAQGSPNYAAPGAHRYKIELKLETIGVDDPVSDDFIEIQRIRSGLVVNDTRISDYSELEKTFARRTFDESGSYTVNPFQLSVREHLRHDTDGRYTEGTFYAPEGDETKIALHMSPGKAYVQGYEISKIAPFIIEMDKARDFDTQNNSITNFGIGNYIYVTHLHNMVRIDEQGLVHLYHFNWDYSGTDGVDYNIYPASGTVGDVEIGTARVRAIKEDGTGVGGATAYRLYLYDINIYDIEVSYIDDGGITVDEKATFEKHVKWIHDPSAIGTRNFTCRILYDPDDENKTYLFEVAKNQMLLSLPNNNVKTFYVGGTSESDTGYAVMRAYRNTGIASGVFRFDAGSNEVFQQDTSKILAYDSATGESIAYTSGDFAFSGTPNGKILNITPIGGETSINIILPVSKQVAGEKSKIRNLDVEKIIINPNKKANSKDMLDKADVMGIRKIYMSQDFSTTPNVNDKDVSSRYTSNTGQRDNYYGIGYISLNSGQPAPTGQLLVIFDYYSHTDGDYFSVDSYIDHDYDKIPTYISSENGFQYSFNDVLDFRPRMGDAQDGFWGAGGSIGDIPQVSSDIRADYEYYLSRIDILFLDPKGIFSIAKGVPNVFPVPPKIPTTAMMLYKLDVNPYTYDPTQVKPTYEDNKRYTMRDIGKIDKRLKNVEYYTALSLLERATASMEILDENGLARFKNGFIVDPFQNHVIGNSLHGDYKCAIDPSEGRLRPTFNQISIGMDVDKDNSLHYQKTGTYLTLPYENVPLIEQLMGSVHENVNPFAVRTYEGEIKYNPDRDDWYETKDVGELLVNNDAHYAALKAMADKMVGTVWNEWQSNWTGVSKTSSTVTTKCRTGNVQRRSDYPSCGGAPVYLDPGHRHVQIGAIADITTTTTIKKLTGVATRSGKKTTYSTDTIVKDLGERTVGMNYIPYMRPLDVMVKVTNMKPGCLVHSFFDDVDMKEYVTPSTRVNITSYQRGPFYTDYGAEEFVVGQTSGAKARVMYARPGYVLLLDDKRKPGMVKAGQKWNYDGVDKFVDGEIIKGEESGAEATITSRVVCAEGDIVFCHDKGEIALILRIPNEGEGGLRFKTGERLFVLNDQPLNAEPNQTFAEGIFKSLGMMLHQENTILSTKTIKMKSETLRQRKAVAKTVVSTSVSKRYYDPLAQTFLVEETGGCFITKLDVFFQMKDPELPVLAQLRNVDNGYPGAQVFTSVSINPEDITVSAVAPGVATTFTFDYPVYLMEGEEYCFVLMTDSFNYNVWVGELGEIDLVTGDIISKQPYNGVLFKSQNASTWTANQYQDMMFRLYKAQFDIDSYANITFNNDDLDAEIFPTNSIETYQGTNLLRVFSQNHGLTPGSTFEIEAIEPSENHNGFLGSDLNGIHIVEDYELDNFTFRMYDNNLDPILATESGMVGGVAMLGYTNIQADVLCPQFTQLVFDGTYTDWAVQTTSGRSVDGDQTEYIVQPWESCTVNENFECKIPTVVASKLNQDISMSGEASLKYKVVMGSDNNNVSPMIELSPPASSLIVCNRIDNPTTTLLTPDAGTFTVSGIGDDELLIVHTAHGMATGANVIIAGFTGGIPGISDDIVNGIHEVRVTSEDGYLIDFDISSTGTYSGDGGGSATIEHSLSHHRFVPDEKSSKGAASARYMTTNIALEDTAENFSLYFAAVKEQYADFDIYYKIRGPYENTDFGDIDWILVANPDNEVLISENGDDYRDYSYTVENLEPYNSVSVKIVMKSTDSTQVPKFKDFRLVCTT